MRAVRAAVGHALEKGEIGVRPLARREIRSWVSWITGRLPARAATVITSGSLWQCTRSYPALSSHSWAWLGYLHAVRVDLVAQAGVHLAEPGLGKGQGDPVAALGQRGGQLVVADAGRLLHEQDVQGPRCLGQGFGGLGLLGLGLPGHGQGGRGGSSSGGQERRSRRTEAPAQPRPLPPAAGPGAESQAGSEAGLAGAWPGGGEALAWPALAW